MDQMTDHGIMMEKGSEDHPHCYTNLSCEEDENAELCNGRSADHQLISITNASTAKHVSGQKFFKDQEITLRVSGMTRSTQHLLHLVIYKIELKYAGYFWNIFREYEQIHAVYISLFFYTDALRLRPEVANRSTADGGRLSTDNSFPQMPKRCNLNATLEEESDHCNGMQIFLNRLFGDSGRREHPASLCFMELSDLSFRQSDSAGGEKMKEVALEKLSCRIWDPIFVTCGHENVACKVVSVWQDRWFVILETCFLYLHQDTGVIAGVFLFDQHMEIMSLKHRPNTLLIKHALKDLVVRFPSKIELDDWLEHFNRGLKITGLDFTIGHPHTSFAPVRENIPVKWFINGAPFMEAVADALDSACEEIFIGGWWVGPDVFLKRPNVGRIKWRLDQVLKRRAEAGVQIYILMYKESPAAMGINSFYSKDKLRKLHPNIKVKRHPDKNVLMWSHHEKIVVIDQKIAFIGGIDLCYGRWDDHFYRITDLSPEMEKNLLSAPLNDKDNTTNYAKEIKKKAKPKSTGHTLQRTILSPWRFGKIQFSQPKHKGLSKFKHNVNRFERSVGGKSSAAYRLFRGSKSDQVSPDDEVANEELRRFEKNFRWIGKDYINEVLIAFRQPKDGSPYEDLLDRTETPRLPWHDASAVIFGKAARDEGRHFIQKWNACKMQKFRFEDESPFLIPKPYNNLQIEEDILPKDCHYCDVQIVRDTASWSSGLLPHVVETSIQKSYIALVQESKHFVYLESQFFITLVGSKKTVQNKFGDALYERVWKAFTNGENFRVYITVPLQPAIAGDYASASGAAVRSVTHWIYQSISRGGHSLFEQLRLNGADPSTYITICGLRQHGVMGRKLMTEIVYVHSKLMIVDDVCTVIGSANMNDRSMLGSRDSEIAMVVRDREFEDSTMDGKPYRSGKFSGRFRRQLMKINLGLVNDMPHGVSIERADKMVEDPVSEDFYRGLWIETAVKNEAIYEEVFNCVPTDKALNYRELKEWDKRASLADTDREKAQELLEGVRGYLYKFPLKFLQDSNMLPPYITLMGLVPAVNWT